LSGRRLLVGLGNELRGDDAAGPLVARAAAPRTPPGAEVIEHQGEPIDLLDLWEGAELVLVADAVVSGAAPGVVQRFDAAAAPLPAAFAAPSTHALGLHEAVELARALGRLPERLVVFAVEGEDFANGSTPGEAVLAAVGRVADAALAELGAAGGDGTASRSPIA
jgi:hydrogenase maturation protease